MNKKYIEIKEQRNGAFTKEIALLVMTVVSLTVALFPFLSASANKTPGPFYLVGGLAFITFLSLFIAFIYKDFYPNNALIISPKGFIDLKNVGDDIEIEWTNVSSVKVLGKGTTPFLGISLENSDIIMEKMRKNEVEMMRENIEDGLPAILIPQNEVRISINDLKDIFIERVRASRTLHNDNKVEKPRSNPFTTADVLRAFGQLPDENDSNEKSSVIENTIVATPSVSHDETTKEISEESITPATDFVTIPDDSETNHEIDDDMPDEIKELLNRARSSKIDELGKILSEKDVPYSLAREENLLSSENANDNIEDSIVENVESIAEPVDETDETILGIDMDEDAAITFVSTDSSTSDDTSFELKLDTMLKNAFDNTRIKLEEEDKSIRYSDKTSDFDAGFFPDLVMFNDIDIEEMPETFDAEKKYAPAENAPDFITEIEDE